MIYGIRSMNACTDLCVCAGGGGGDRTDQS
jgi:hypothetical protein